MKQLSAHGHQDRLLQIIDGKKCACEPTEMLKLLSTCREVGGRGHLTQNFGCWESMCHFLGSLIAIFPFWSSYRFTGIHVEIHQA